MADEVPQDVAAAIIDRVASNQMGVDPNQAPVAKEAAEEAPTETEKAVEEGAPKTEQDAMAMDAIMYEIEFGEGEKRQLTPQQISNTFKRYSDLNFKNAQMKPVNMVVEAAIKNGLAKDPTDAARQLIALMKGGESNPTMGDTDGTTNVAVKGQDSGDPLQQWEEDNAVALPPGYREQGQMMTSMMEQNQQLMQAMTQMLQNTQATAQQGSELAASGVADKSSAMATRITNNLDRMAQKMGLAEDQAEDFRVFAFERGYTSEDFLDPQLTMKVGNDYKNSVQSGDMERLREIAKRRQAFTGTVGNTPQSEMASETGVEADGDPTLNRLAGQRRV
nr:hypothetical protein [uncultured Mediterranean phage uvMED]